MMLLWYLQRCMKLTTVGWTMHGVYFASMITVLMSRLWNTRYLIHVEPLYLVLRTSAGSATGSNAM